MAEGRLLGGFCFEPHIDSERWLQFFVLPLFLPTEDLELTWGWRIPAITSNRNRSYRPVRVEGDEGQIEETARVLQEEGLPSLEGYLSLEGFYKFVTDRRKWGCHPSPAVELEAHGILAGISILRGDAAMAARHIRDAEAYASHHSTLAISSRDPDAWERWILDLLPALDAGDVSPGRLALDEWQAFTISRLGIGDLL
ncbi:MAG TPA: hypothetical protein VMI31_00165 [Fimbriimonadaceae bacterium]|nr:hypothetical protein [Fimbriimonadaceae bacterium]